MNLNFWALIRKRKCGKNKRIGRLSKIKLSWIVLVKRALFPAPGCLGSSKQKLVRKPATVFQLVDVLLPGEACPLKSVFWKHLLEISLQLTNSLFKRLVFE